MYLKDGTIEELHKAMEEVNKRFDNNIEFNRVPEHYGNKIRFTLKVKDSKKEGHRLGSSYGDNKQRRLISACWHVHGYFFEEVFKINPNAMIISRNKEITKDYGNWEDDNIGSQMNPLYHSEACDCE